jgi:hypothetical protein
MTTWAQHNDPFAKDGETEGIISTAPIAGLAGVRATMSISCVRADEKGDNWPSGLKIGVAVSGGTLDVEPTVKTVEVKLKWNASSPSTYSFAASDNHRFSYSITSTPSPSDFADYLLGFSSDGTDVALRIKSGGPVIQGFLGRCAALSKKQVQLIKDAEKKAAEEESHYTKNTWTDPSTGLMWERTSPSASGTWQECVDYCKNLSLDRYTDWRLPTYLELATLRGHFGDATKDTVRDPSDGELWSSTLEQHWGEYHYLGRPDALQDYMYAKTLKRDGDYDGHNNYEEAASELESRRVGAIQINIRRIDVLCVRGSQK